MTSRLDNGDGAQHGRKQPIAPNKDHSIGDRQSWLRGDAPAQYVQLMPEKDDFGFQSRLRPEG
jgi:hypothetical protein